MTDGRKIIEMDGRRYEYDADFDCYRRVQDQPDSKYGWIVVTIAVAIVAFLVEHYKG